jgi:hypothetical protein
MQWASITGKPQGAREQRLQSSLNGSAQEDGDDALSMSLRPLMKEGLKPHRTLLYRHQHGIPNRLRQCEPKQLRDFHRWRSG